MRFVEFKTPNGLAVKVNPEEVSLIRHCGQAGDGNLLTELMVSGTLQVVRGTVDEVEVKLLAVRVI